MFCEIAKRTLQKLNDLTQCINLQKEEAKRELLMQEHTSVMRELQDHLDNCKECNGR